MQFIFRNLVIPSVQMEFFAILLHISLIFFYLLAGRNNRYRAENGDGGEENGETNGKNFQESSLKSERERE